MQNAFRELLRLINKAEYGWGCGCSTTTRAYLRMASAATFELLKHTANKEERDKLLSACNYSAQFCSQQKNYGEVVQFMAWFWCGVEDGFYKNTFIKQSNKHYEIGYKLGRHGS